jgi:uncharacterized protein YceK
MLFRIIVLALVLPLLGGCSVSVWERSFVATGEVAQVASNAPVRVREVDWGRLQAGLERLQRAAAESDVPESEWPRERREEAKAELLRVLQVTGDPAAVEVVGRSDFRTTSELRPERDEDLVRLARKVGATEVVWSRRLLGKGETIIREPVTTYSTDWGWGRRRRGGLDSSTAWVPVVVAADEYAYVAYFLRR